MRQAQGGGKGAMDFGKTKARVSHNIPVRFSDVAGAEEEKRELERARLKNVEHEKFNFDDTGVEASLVLERAMQEAENYIAERKKYIQDTQQINSDITQEDMNYREITKEYNRQMQVSKETFENFKAQLAEASSTIEANYLKKQQQQELDRQRNLERDFDTATNAIRLAQTGHLVLATVHSSDGLGVISKLINMNIQNFLIFYIIMFIFYSIYFLKSIIISKLIVLSSSSK